MKKTTGTIMVVLGCIFAIGLVGGLPRAVSHISDVTARQGWNTYVYGYVGGQILAIVVACLLITFGLQLGKGKEGSAR